MLRTGRMSARFGVREREDRTKARYHKGHHGTRDDDERDIASIEPRKFGQWRKSSGAEYNILANIHGYKWF